MARAFPLALVTLLLACLFPAGCESDTPPVSAFTVRDSAGIEVVESSEPQLGPDAWTVSPEPVLEIGEAEGDKHYLFSNVPIEVLAGIGGTFRLGDGRIGVCDGTTRTVRIFDRQGRFLSQFGRDGGGPGEFERSIRACIPHGEGIAVAEGDRLSHFDSEGLFLDRVASRIPTATISGVFPDGSLLTQRLDVESLVRVMERTPSGVYPVEAIVGAVQPDGTAEDWTVLAHHSRRAGFNGYIMEQPFAPKLLLTVWGNAFVYGWADAYELQVFNREGALRQILRRDVDPAPVTPQDREWFADSLSQTMRGTEDARQSLEGLIFPDHLATFDRLLVDRLGDLWVRRFEPRAALTPAGAPSPYPMEWDVFDPSGRWLTTVTLPLGVVIHDIGEEYVLGVWLGDMGVPYVRMYSLDRGNLP